MKRPKPGFKNFIKTRIRHPLAMTVGLVYTNGSGERFRDAGSELTRLIPVILVIFLFLSQLALNLTILGRVMILAPLMLLRFLRYFWTNFKPVGDEGEEAADTNAPEDRGAFWSIVLTALVMIAVFTAALILMGNSPCSVNYKINEDRECFVQNVDTFDEAYALARGRFDELFPEFQLIDYGVEIRDRSALFTFVFRNPMRGLLMNKAVSSIIVFIENGEKWIEAHYYRYDTPFSRFEPLTEPVTEVDTEKIIDIALKEASLNGGSADYISVETHFWKFDTPDITDPGGHTWAVKIRTEGTRYYYVVDLEKETAVDPEVIHER